MEEVESYRLDLLSPLHLGERGIGMEEAGEVLHSDTLFSALCWAITQVGGTGLLEEWLEAFRGRPPLLISSAFPWAGAVRFFPRPMVRLGWAASTDPPRAGLGKRLKKVVHVSESLFQRLLEGGDLESELVRENLLPGGMWIATAEREKLPPGLGSVWTSPGPVPHVALDRSSAASSLYHVGEVRYAPDCGLWFAVRWRDTGWRGLLERALSYLGEAGVGGERSAGRGQFRLAGREPLSLPDPSPPVGRAVTLSPYHPTRQEVDAGVLEGASYRLAMRRGWISSGAGQGLRSKAVRMLAEGSVVGSRTDLGDLVDVTPEGFEHHRVYRYGLAFPVGLEVDGDG